MMDLKEEARALCAGGYHCKLCREAGDGGTLCGNAHDILETLKLVRKDSRVDLTREVKEISAGLLRSLELHHDAWHHRQDELAANDEDEREFVSERFARNDVGDANDIARVITDCRTAGVLEEREAAITVLKWLGAPGKHNTNHPRAKQAWLDFADRLESGEHVEMAPQLDKLPVPELVMAEECAHRRWEWRTDMHRFCSDCDGDLEPEETMVRLHRPYSGDCDDKDCLQCNREDR